MQATTLQCRLKGSGILYVELPNKAEPDASSLAQYNQVRPKLTAPYDHMVSHHSAVAWQRL